MSARYLQAFERIREMLLTRSQAEPLLTAMEIQMLLGGWPDLRTVQRYMLAIRDDAIVAKRQTAHSRIDRLSRDEKTPTHIQSVAVHDGGQATGTPNGG